ncbi:UNVERIFIED_CONTAM: putative xyloglucan endotransglucosylase/hydrolase protein 30 [Sesamum radiatum]|uniref:Xyloglucan endotransglucosylase/hydrolase protein 30 n=1 Tax=Sesamum radiatum TaxID=300843 RepID=A0AAW2V8X8_SESRA
MGKLQFHSLPPPIMIIIIITFLLLLHVSSSFAAPHPHHRPQAPSAFNISTILFTTGFTPLFGSGFKSSDLYNHGLFSAKIKLPSDYTAGIVVAFYTTNGDIFRKTHDELGLGGFRQT